MNQIKISREIKTAIQPGMFGLFFEDINYAADGGLYAEMLENRNFEFRESRGCYDHYSQEFAGLYGWSAYPAEGKGTLLLDTRMPQNPVNPHLPGQLLGEGGGLPGPYPGGCGKRRTGLYTKGGAWGH